MNLLQSFVPFVASKQDGKLVYRQFPESSGNAYDLNKPVVRARLLAGLKAFDGGCTDAPVFFRATGIPNSGKNGLANASSTWNHLVRKVVPDVVRYVNAERVKNGLDPLACPSIPIWGSGKGKRMTSPENEATESDVLAALDATEAAEKEIGEMLPDADCPHDGEQDAGQDAGQDGE